MKWEESEHTIFPGRTAIPKPPTDKELASLRAAEKAPKAKSVPTGGIQARVGIPPHLAKRDMDIGPMLTDDSDGSTTSDEKAIEQCNSSASNNAMARHPQWGS